MRHTAKIRGAGAGLCLLLLAGAGVPGAAQGNHWSFRPPVRPAVPTVKSAAWVRNPVDAFVLARLEEKGLKPAPEADRRTLIRRVTFDLTGLPPAPHEIAAFLADKRPDAYERLVDRLLASPRYGERWAQHWLDVVRFAETNGYELDADRPQAWRYRDYVVRALNADTPYNTFLLEQIAGDEIAPNRFEARAATGFLRAGPRHVVSGNIDPAENRQEWLTEAVGGVGSAVLGLTVSCARCHDHKYDPVSQRDYYGLQAFFAAADNADFKPATPEAKKAHADALKTHERRLKPIKDEIAGIEKPYNDRLRAEKRARLEPHYRLALDTPAKDRTPEQRRQAEDAATMVAVAWDELLAALAPADRDRRALLRAKIHRLELEAPEPPPFAPGVADALRPVPPTRLLIRGEWSAPGPEVAPAFLPALKLPGAPPSVLAPDAPPDSTGRRLALARWLTRPGHPLTARVLVNRVWLHHFGRGLVATPNDFGLNGTRPTHPELLDWLAVSFTAPQMNWSPKKLHRLLVTSGAYRQSGAFDAKAAKADPDNRLLWRARRRRLDAEALRDAILATAGTLNPQAGGPSVRAPLEPEVVATVFTEGEPDNLWPVHPDPRQHTRRSLYLIRKRNVRVPLLAAFDQPDSMTSCAARGQSVSALQALTLLNSPFLREQSRAFAARLLREHPNDAARRVERLFNLTLGRPPRPAERDATARFLRDQAAAARAQAQRGEAVPPLPDPPEGADPAEAAAWSDLCLAAFNLNDFLTVH